MGKLFEKVIMKIVQRHSEEAQYFMDHDLVGSKHVAIYTINECQCSKSVVL
jgi:hypothetical protein